MGGERDGARGWMEERGAGGGSDEDSDRETETERRGLDGGEEKEQAARSEEKEGELGTAGEGTAGKGTAGKGTRMAACSDVERAQQCPDGCS